jgi:hypothetical protein
VPRTKIADRNGGRFLTALHDAVIGIELLPDLNCDGVASDLDGDGHTRPGDLTLGADKADDCNDLDPRVSTGDSTVADQLNDAQCSVNLASILGSGVASGARAMSRKANKASWAPAAKAWCAAARSPTARA